MMTAVRSLLWGSTFVILSLPVTAGDGGGLA
jgi:hypothetical protein